MHPSRDPSQLSYLRHAALPGVELLVANPSLESWRMLHERYLVCGCVLAATRWVYRRKTHMVVDGTTGFMEPGEIHKVVAKAKPTHFLALFIEPRQFIRIAEKEIGPGTPHFRVASVASPPLVTELIRLSNDLSSGAEALQLQSQLAVLMQQILNYVESKPRTCAPRMSGAGLRKSLGRARELLRERFHERINLDELASASAVSRFHLARSFTKEFGLPPHAYLVQLRVKHACKLLRAGMPCVETAASVGFADQSHFARHFKRIMGVTPSQYASGKLSHAAENGEAWRREAAAPALVVP